MPTRGLARAAVDVLTGLNPNSPDPEWSYVGVGRDDGKQGGEYSPILFRKKVWAVEEWKTVWLSETPEKPGKGWNAGSVKIATVATLGHVKSRKSIVGVCTHLDNAGAVSRRESAKLILEVIGKAISADYLMRSRQLPVFLAGDFNSEPSDEAYQLRNASNSSIQDSRELATWKYGNQVTYIRFLPNEEQSLIDFIFVGPRGASDLEVKGCSVLANRFDDGVYSSDHWGVVMDGVVEV